MSARAYRLAVRDQLQKTLQLDADSCEAMFDGQPKPLAGELFVAIHPGGGWRGESGDYDLSERIGCMVTVTRRLGYVPQDETGPEVLDRAAAGLEDVMRKVLVAIHMRYSVMGLPVDQNPAPNSANGYIKADGGSQSPGFVEPLRFQSADDKPTVRGPDWFSAPPPEADTPTADAGLSWSMTFGGAFRVQGIVEDVVT